MSMKLMTASSLMLFMAVFAGSSVAGASEPSDLQALKEIRATNPEEAQRYVAGLIDMWAWIEKDRRIRDHDLWIQAQYIRKCSEVDELDLLDALIQRWDKTSVGPHGVHAPEEIGRALLACFSDAQRKGEYEDH